MLSKQILLSGLAQSGPPDGVIILFIIGVISLALIIVTLTRHQQKMTLLMRQNDLAPQPLPNSDVQSLQYDVQQLKSMVSSLAMSVDSLKDEVRNSNSIQDRVKNQE